MPDGTALDTLGVIFDGTFDGFMTIVYMYYYDKLRPNEIVLLDMFQQTIGTKYVTVETDIQKADKALKGIRDKFTNDMYEKLCYAYVNCDSERFIHIFRYIILCFKHGLKANSYTQIDSVIKTHHYARNTGHEIQLLRGFTRFAETSTGVLYADISPDNDVLPMLADFFSDRLNSENWVIHDVRREIAAMYNGSEWVMTEAPSRAANINVDTSEYAYQNLWTVFYNTIAIKERINPKLQKAMKPKKFWKHMTEHKNIIEREKYNRDKYKT